MTLLGNLLLVGAAFFYVFPLQNMLQTSPRGIPGAALFASVILVAVPLWVLLTASTCAATAIGGLDWIGRKRSLQYLMVLVSGSALLVTTVFCHTAKLNFSPQTPAFAGWFTKAVLQAFPLVVLGFSLLALNPGLAKFVPPQPIRFLLIAVTGTSLLVSTGLVIRRSVTTRPPASGHSKTPVEANGSDESDTPPQ